MKTFLKKSFEQFVEEQNEFYEQIKSKQIVELKGDLYLDLGIYFHEMVWRGMFYRLPRNYAFKSEHRLEEFIIGLYELKDSYIYKSASFMIALSGELRVSVSLDGNKLLRDKFFNTMNELIKQMNQYYIDHDLQNKSQD